MAMKVLSKKSIVEADEVVKLRTEKSILTKLDSPFLVKLHFSFQSNGTHAHHSPQRQATSVRFVPFRSCLRPMPTDKIFFVMDYINGGELFFHLQQQERGFTSERVKFYAAEILLGATCLQARVATSLLVLTFNSQTKESNTSTARELFIEISNPRTFSSGVMVMSA